MISDPRRPVGVRDVAAAAGVSRQTVSRVLNEHPDVAEATKERVRAAMSDLGYRMNNAARALGTKRTRTIGVVASDALQYGPSRSIAAIEASARAAGFWVSAAFADSGDADSVRSAVAHLQAQAVDGLIVFAPHASALDALDGLDVGVPVAMLHAGGRGESGLSVDQVAGARLAVRALVGAGHRHIAHISGPEEWMEASARTAGFVAELAAHGLDPVAIVRGDWTAGSGHRAAAAIDESGATAVFASNDQMALGLIGGLRERGVRVSEDVSIVGFDDAPDAAFFWPPLTTVRQDFEELARRAVAAVTGEGLVSREPVAPVLVERASIHALRRRSGIARQGNP
ncbi:LacI family DNA-binding transcriptional regulator [Microbacterium sp. A196]|uniref:LacI family DNA-binding transcriptional regulator n=1 Tax=Microbacterium sp. A196 TaxID=3457320 RepID=UPI003FCEF4F6